MVRIEGRHLVMHKVPDGTDVIAQFLGEEQGFANQSPHSLPQLPTNKATLAAQSRLHLYRGVSYLARCLNY